MELKRIDENRCIVEGKGIDVVLFANKEVDIDKKGIAQIVEFTEITETLEKLKLASYLPKDASIKSIIETPDSHYGGSGIPIGTVLNSHKFIIPRAVGNDVGCGMMEVTTDISFKEFNTIEKNKLTDHLRYIYFEGGRQSPTTREMRRLIIEQGIPGLLKCNIPDIGIWKHFDKQAFGERIGIFNKAGDYKYLFDEYVNKGEDLRYDTQLGSIGGGNHFVEFQRIINSSWNDFGMNDVGNLTIMAHTGSVSMGSAIWDVFGHRIIKEYPKNIKKPSNDFYILDSESNTAKQYLSVMNGGCNFASINRVILVLMAIKALSELLNRNIGYNIVFDAPHNFIEEKGNENFIHRKGACPAYENDPVIIPGSMGSSSFVLKGHGLAESNFSACHGAGRKTSRGKSRHIENNDPLEGLLIVTKIGKEITRPDILEKYNSSLREEAPDCYKDILPVIETVESAGIATRVCELSPILTIKGI